MCAWAIVCVYLSCTVSELCPTSSIRITGSTPASRIMLTAVCLPPSCSLITGTPAALASALHVYVVMS
jgi:hypothetical protein